MARNGAGTYNLPAGNPVTTGTTISSSWANSTLSDMANALTGSIASDGQTTPTNNLPMGNYAHTAVGNATVRNMYASAGQVQDCTFNYLTGITGTNAILGSANVGMISYATGQTFRLIAAAANTGACTLNINSIGAKAIKRTDGSDLIAGDIALGAALEVMYDGTNFQLLTDANGKSETFTNVTITGTLDVGGTLTGVDVTTTGNTILGNASTDTLNVGNGGLVKDASGNVGIGTASPNAPLTFPSSTGRKTGFYQGTEGYSIGVEASNFKFVTDASAVFTWANGSTYSSATEYMRLDSSGNLGIGTTTPSSFSSAADNLVVGTTSGDNGITVVTGTSNQGSLFFADGTTGGAQNAAGFIYYLHTSDYMAFGTANTERMRLDAAGNLGIGVVPWSWDSGYRSIDVYTDGAGYAASGNAAVMSVNSYVNGGVWKYKGTSIYKPSTYSQFNGAHTWQTAAAAGSAGNTITFNTAMTLDANANLTVTGQISGGYYAPAAGTTAMAFGSYAVTKVTPNATATFTTTVPAAGAIATLIILTSGSSSYTITFGSGFKTTGTLATGTTTNRNFVISFVSDGTNMLETSRTAAYAA